MEPRLKLGGPPSKAKYSSMTDSELVPWGKGEKNPCEGSEKNLKPCVYKQLKYIKVRQRAFCIMSLRVTVSGKVKAIAAVEAKASLNRASSRLPLARSPVIYPCAG